MTPTVLYLAKCGVKPDIAAVYADPFAAACIKAAAFSREQVAAFTAQALHESLFMTKMGEDLNYSAGRLMAVWPHRFPTHDIADQYAHAPQKLANFVYGNRTDLGNGQASTNDGWNFRGSGLIEVTGRNNFFAADKFLGTDYIHYPEMPRTIPTDACMISAWFWSANHLNLALAQGGIDAVSHKINPYDGKDATANRHDLFARCLAVSTD